MTIKETIAETIAELHDAKSACDRAIINLYVVADSLPEPTPDTPSPEPDPDINYPGPAPPSIQKLTSYRWEPSEGNPKYAGLWVLLLPGLFTGKVRSVHVNGYGYDFTKLHNGAPLYHGPAKSKMVAPYKISVMTLDGNTYEAVENSVVAGGWNLPAGLKQGDCDEERRLKAHNNPNAWKRGYCGFVAGKDTPSGNMYICQKGKKAIKGQPAGDDEGRPYWIWATKGLAAKLTKPIYIVHSKGFYWYIKDPTKKYYGKNLKGDLPNG